MCRRDRKEWKVDDMLKGAKMIKKEEDIAWRMMNWEGERRRA